MERESKIDHKTHWFLIWATLRPQLNPGWRLQGAHFQYDPRRVLPPTGADQHEQWSGRGRIYHRQAPMRFSPIRSSSHRFQTRRSKQVCANPSEPWVQDYVNDLELNWATPGTGPGLQQRPPEFDASQWDAPSPCSLLLSEVPIPSLNLIFIMCCIIVFGIPSIIMLVLPKDTYPPWGWPTITVSLLLWIRG